MPVLSNPRHESFAQALAKGKSAAEAYKAAGYKGDRTAASRLSTNVNVQRRVTELKEKAAEKAEVTAKDVLVGLYKEATREGEGASHSARVAAWGLLGKYHNLFTDRVEAKITSDVTVNDARTALEHLIDRQLAAGAAQGGTGKPN